jgi:hypothetical protein
MESSTVNEDLVRDVYLFFELVCKRCPTVWAPDPNAEIAPGPEPWAERFSAYFGRQAQAAGWGSVDGNVVCPVCLRKPNAT